MKAQLLTARYSIGIRVSWCSRRAATQASTSSFVDSGPKLMRMTPPETFFGSFRVAMTWLGLP